MEKSSLPQQAVQPPSKQPRMGGIRISFAMLKQSNFSQSNETHSDYHFPIAAMKFWFHYSDNRSLWNNSPASLEPDHCRGLPRNHQGTKPLGHSRARLLHLRPRSLRSQSAFRSTAENQESLGLDRRPQTPDDE